MRDGKRAAANDRDDEPGHEDLGPIPSAWTVDAPDLSAFDRHMAGWWKQCAYRPDLNSVVVLDLIRIHAPRAWDWLMLDDVAASGLAIRRDWLRPKERHIPDDEEKAAVRAAVAAWEAVVGKGGGETTPAAQERPPLTRRKLVELIETWKAMASKENGGFVRVVALIDQLAAMDAAATAERAAPVEEDDAPWVPSGLAA